MKQAIALAENVFCILYRTSGLTGTLPEDIEPFSEVKALKEIWHGSEI
jgi:hypothetical protein